MRAFCVTIPGEPVAKGRPRFMRATGHVYTPEKTSKAEREIAILSKKQFKEEGHDKIISAVQLSCKFGFTMPTSWSNGKKALMEGSPCTKRPDADNLVKLVCDSLNNAEIWSDDSLVAEMSVCKIWMRDPKTVIRIFWSEQ